MTHFNNGTFDFNSLEPQAVYNYLEENRWREERKIDTRASILTTAKNDKKYSILLPLDREIPNFASLMYDVFTVLEAVENRSRSQIITALINSDEIAREKQCEIISLKLKFIEEDRRQLPAKKMGAFLTNLQKVFDAVGESVAGVNSDGYRTIKKVLKKTELSVFETFQGSFGIKLALPPNSDRLSEKPLAERVAATFLDLVRASSLPDKEHLNELLLKLDKKAASNYRQFLVSLNSLKADLDIEWGSVNPNSGGRSSLSNNCIQTTVKHIKSWGDSKHKIIRTEGTLLIANLTRKTVKIKDAETGKTYLAKFDEKLLNDPKIDLTIGQRYSATLEEITSINPATGTELTVLEIAYLD